MKPRSAGWLPQVAAILLLALAIGIAAAGTEDWGLYCADLEPGQPAQHGAAVTQVLPGSAAASAGIRAGDIVATYAGRGIASVGELDAAIAAHPKRSFLRLGILRDGKPLEVLLSDAPPPTVPVALPSPAQQAVLAALRAGDSGRAETLARNALQAEPRHAGLWNLLGEALHRQKKAEAAIQAYREALRLDPGLPSANVNLGALVLEQGQRDEARTLFERAAASDPAGHAGDLARQRLAGLDMARAQRGEGPAFAARPDGLKALVEVASVEVQATDVPPGLGGGLREMLVTALHGSGYFIVIESGEQSRRQLAGERALTRAQASDPGAARSQAAADTADIEVFGALVHFDPKAAGSTVVSPIMGLPFGIIGNRITVSQITIEISVADGRSGQLLARQQIPGIARSVRGIIGAALPGTGAAMPSSLDVYRNTPMELALRDCMQKAAYFVANNIPQEYFVRR